MGWVGAVSMRVKGCLPAGVMRRDVARACQSIAGGAVHVCHRVAARAGLQAGRARRRTCCRVEAGLAGDAAVAVHGGGAGRAGPALPDAVLVPVVRYLHAGRVVIIGKNQLLPVVACYSIACVWMQPARCERGRTDCDWAAQPTLSAACRPSMEMWRGRTRLLACVRAPPWSLLFAGARPDSPLGSGMRCGTTVWACAAVAAKAKVSSAHSNISRDRRDAPPAASRASATPPQTQALGSRRRWRAQWAEAPSRREGAGVASSEPALVRVPDCGPLPDPRMPLNAALDNVVVE